jgi:hypothetical protein
VRRPAPIRRASALPSRRGRSAGSLSTASGRAQPVTAAKTLRASPWASRACPSRRGESVRWRPPGVCKVTSTSAAGSQPAPCGRARRDRSRHRSASRTAGSEPTPRQMHACRAKGALNATAAWGRGRTKAGLSATREFRR